MYIKCYLQISEKSLMNDITKCLYKARFLHLHIPHMSCITGKLEDIVLSPMTKVPIPTDMTLKITKTKTLKTQLTISNR